MSKIKNKSITPEKHKWLYWRNIGDKSFSKSFIQNIIETPKGMLLELSDGYYTACPLRLLRKEIFILQIEDDKP